MMPEPTAQQLAEAIPRAIRANDFPAVAELLRRLAAVDPQAADEILAAIRRGMAVVAQFDGRGDG